MRNGLPTFGVRLFFPKILVEGLIWMMEIQSMRALTLKFHCLGEMRFAGYPKLPV